MVLPAFTAWLYVGYSGASGVEMMCRGIAWTPCLKCSGRGSEMSGRLIFVARQRDLVLDRAEFPAANGGTELSNQAGHGSVVGRDQAGEAAHACLKRTVGQLGQQLGPQPAA